MGIRTGTLFGLTHLTEKNRFVQGLLNLEQLASHISSPVKRDNKTITSLNTDTYTPSTYNIADPILPCADECEKNVERPANCHRTAKKTQRMRRSPYPDAKIYGEKGRVRDSVGLG